MVALPKAEGAFLTIGEVSAEVGVAQHILRFWESRFVQLRPLTRAGNRRYYRPDDVALVRRIDDALNRKGYTIKGVQRLLAGQPAEPDEATDIAHGLLRDLNRIRAALLAALAE